MNNLDNLTLTTINGIGMNAANWALDFSIAQGTGALFDWLNGRNDTLKFYYDYDSGGKIYQVLARGIVGGAVGTIADMAVNAFNGLIEGKKVNPEITTNMAKEWNNRRDIANQSDAKEYGSMRLEEGTVYALDEWGEIAYDALMLGIKTDKMIHVKQKFPSYVGATGNDRVEVDFTTKTLVWYDTTAIVNISSDKNVITTRVQGRDYSRKELVSNGDIKFSVSGQISSGLPDVYPTAEVEKFFKVMQHKGIVQVNCQVLNVLGVEQILITDFNLSCKEGSKSVQSYSFSGLGLQPAREIEITEDTVDIIIPDAMKKEDKDDNPWISMLEDKAKAAAEDIFSRAVAWSTGLLMDKL